VRFHLFFGGTQSAHFGGSPIEIFPVVTLWRPLQQMSVETILYKFLNEKTSSYQLMYKRYSDRYYVFQDSRVAADKKNNR